MTLLLGMHFCTSVAPIGTIQQNRMSRLFSSTLIWPKKYLRNVTGRENNPRITQGSLEICRVKMGRTTKEVREYVYRHFTGCLVCMKDFTHSSISTYEHSKDDLIYMYRHFAYNLLCMIWRLYQSAFHIIWWTWISAFHVIWSTCIHMHFRLLDTCI